MSGIKITWEESNKNEHGYEVYKTSSSTLVEDLPAPVATLAKNTKEYSDSGADILVDNYYRIAAYGWGAQRKKFSPEIHVPAWTFYDMFKTQEQGVWYDPSDLTTLYQDSIGSIPVANDGDPVGLMLDKGQGLSQGPELIDNPNFDVDSNWTKGTGWIISSGKATHTGAGGDVKQTLSGKFIVGKWYKATVQIDTTGDMSISNTSFQIRNSANTSSVVQILAGGITPNAVNNLTLVFQATETTHVARVYSEDDVAVDNYSVKELRGHHATQPTSAKRPLYRRGDHRGVVNLFSWSENLDDASWSKTEASVTPNLIDSPFGGTTADKVIPTTANNIHAIYKNTSILSGTTYTLTVYAKASGYNFLQLTESAGFSSVAFQNYNLSNGTLGNGNLSGGAKSSIEDVGDGWYRCSFTATATATATGRILPLVYNSDVTSRASMYAGDGTSGIYLWGMQFETGLTITAYQINNSHLGGVATGNETDLRWLEFDGVDDYMENTTLPVTQSKTLVFGRYFPSNTGNWTVIEYPATLHSYGLYNTSSGSGGYGFNTWNADVFGTGRQLNESGVDFAIVNQGNPEINGSSLNINGVSQTLSRKNTSPLVRTGINGINIGRGSSTVDQLYPGYFYQIMSIPKSLTSVKVEEIHKHVLNKTGIDAVINGPENISHSYV